MSDWTWRNWGVMVLLVVGIFVAQHAGPRGFFPVAEGCSGYGTLGGPAGWRYFVIASQSERERVEVGTDGFVLLEATFTGDDGDEEVEPAEIEVTASDQAGPVAGHLELLRSVTRPGRANATGTAGSVFNYWGWQADEPLPVGSILQLSFGISNGLWPISDTVELEVVGEPAALPTPSGASFGNWVDYRRGDGDLVECTIDLSDGSCSGLDTDTILVPEREVQHRANDTLWDVPEVAGMVAWEARVELSGPLGDGVASDEVAVVGGVDVGPVDTGFIVFPSDAEEYCVVLVIEDLRTGEEVRSEPACGDPEQATSTVRAHRLDQCIEPPTPASKDLWCESHPDHIACLPGGASGGAGPSEAGQASVGDAGEESMGGRTSSGEPKPRARNAGQSDSCRFRPAPAGVAPHALALLLGLGLVLGRRLGARYGRR
jgi:hypothetical protein